MHFRGEDEPQVPEEILRPGFKLCDRFEVIGSIGSGSSAVAVKSRDTFTDEVVICKVVGFGTERVRALEEYRKLRIARVPSLAAIMGYFEHLHARSQRTLPVLVLELVDGLTLDRWCESKPLRERIRALAQVAEALAALHGAKLNHGDVSTSNVIYREGRGAILIDPAPELHLEADSIVSGMNTDLGDLAELIGDWGNANNSPLLADLQRRLSSGHTTAREGQLVLESISRWSLLADEQIESLRARKERAHADRAELYDRLRQLRQVGLFQVFEQIKQLGTAANVKTEMMADAEDVRLEAASSTADARGHLAGSQLSLMTPEGDSWLIELEPARSFGKPTPFGDVAVLATGTCDVHVDGTRLWHERVELRSMEDGVMLFRRDPFSVLRPADSKWMLSNVHRLLGLALPAISAPLPLGGTPQSPDRWPTNLRLDETGDLEIRNGNLSIVRGSAWLEQELRTFLGTRPGDVPTSPTFGSRIHEVAEVPRKAALGVVERVVREELVTQFASYIATLTYFDVIVQSRSPASVLRVETGIEPHGIKEALDFVFELHFP
jgi:serine/threonine protein kinase